MDHLQVQLQHLTEAEAHVARAAELVFDQEMRVARFELYGYDSTLAVPSWTFRLVQTQHIAHRDYILRGLDL